VAYEAGDIFLLCTDGLVEGLYDNHIAELLRPPESAGAVVNPAHHLVAESLEKDGRDNTTALVIRMA
jgi:PPM family protein phosphatase